MRIIAKKTLITFWEIEQYKDSKSQLEAWYQMAIKAEWKKPNEIKEQFKSASILGDNRIVFNIAGNKYRLIVKINYPFQTIYIRFIGTHKEYDKIDALEV